MAQFRILVTGVGAIIGYGIVRSLRHSDYALEIIGADIYADAVGQVWCDRFVQAQRADSDAYENYLLETVRSHRIDLIIPGIEQDIDRCGEFAEKILSAGARLAINSRSALAIFNDKLETYDLLERLRLPCIPYRRATFGRVEEIIEDIGLPCIVKKRRSYAGKGLRVIDTLAECHLYSESPDYLFQRYIFDGIEYTISIFGTGDGTFVSPIALERSLGPDGATHKAATVEFSRFEQQVDLLCRAVSPVGPTNFQFMADRQGQLFLLEVNPRISSSTSIRSRFGVNEAEMCIEYYLEDRLPSERKPRKGTAQRYIDEIVQYDGDSL